ncbi:DNRLRE domain-containing protein [Paenibacillus sp. WQ 127069]|uniref:DNRLRE domain-containing protein n=1 Tax=Paenibacillus baimaensis TaxID=2982185 RepID=A0ABT2UJF0_9BACL|nr:DNRLRE domain-containing protein [Paenibacillus sp. WQ 127069]MCU6794156.1 DNRLRE domain-containing protein [Paenibacillus sp. WQ 127069]
MATIRCYSVADMYVDGRYSTTINVNYGNSWLLDHDSYKRSFIKFDLSQIPAGSVINNAYLVLTPYQQITGGQNWRFNIASQRNAWNEYTGTYNNTAALIEEDFGYVANQTLPANVPFALNDVRVKGWIHAWVNQGRSNYGITITWGLGYITFYARECVSNGFSQDFVPYIVVDFTPPNVPPNAPILNSPANGVWYNTGSPLVSWGFSDPDAGNYQGNAAVHIFEHYSNSVVRDTGWAFGGAQSWYINPPLPDGTYRYRVITQDQSGAAGPWSWEPVFYVDTTPPTVTITAPTSNAVLVTRTPTISWSFSDNMTGQQAYLLEIVNASYTAVLWSSDWVADENARSRVTPDLGEGRFCARMTARDLAGNYRSLEITNTWYTVDVTAPTTSNHSFSGYSFGQATNASSGTLRLNWTYNDATPQKSYVIAGSNTAWASWTYYSELINSGNNYHDIPFSSLAEGTWLFALYVYDSAGNVSEPSGGYSITIDRTNPTIVSTSPQQYTNGTTATVYIDGVSDDRSGINIVTVYQVRPDGSYYQINNASLVSSGKYAINVTDLNIEGNWRFDFRVFDKAGNQAGGVGAMYSAYVMRDTSAPIIGSGDGDRYSNQNSGTIRHTVSNVSDATSGISSVTFQFRKSPDNGATWDAWGTVFNGTQSGTSWYYDVPISGDGYYEIAVMAYDRVNNASAYYYMHTTVDSVLANDPNSKVIYQQTTATFTWDAFSDPNPSSGRKSTDFYLYEWDGTSMGAVFHMGNDIGNVTTYTQTGLKAGQRYRYTVTYHDKAGNESSYTYKEFITKKQIGARKIHKADADIMLPIYALDSGVLGSKSYRIACGSGVVGCYELVDPSDPNASSERINTPQGVKALSK